MLRNLFWEIYGRGSSLLILIVLAACQRLTGQGTSGNVWLIGENRGDCLSDNGFSFYKYCRAREDGKEVYFVGKASNPIIQEELAGDDHILRYGSFRHAVIFCQASTCFYTHTYRDLTYRRFFEWFGGGKDLVYLHHGVLGFKKFDHFYHMKRNIMRVFTVGSNLEKSILLDQAGVDRERVQVTGYARYDSLRDQSDVGERQIVYMPTHRNYLSSRKDVGSFISRINSFLNSENLIELLKRNKAQLLVCPHRQMYKYLAAIKPGSERVKGLGLSDSTPRDLICSGSLLITDYSSVAWDFFYLGKPVVFFRFDMAEYLQDRGSYLDLEDPLIGDIASDEEGVIELVERYCDNGFQLTPQHAAFRKENIPHFDGNNCSRIYDAANSRLV
jgi:CDP-glycerol glycerophosphotransferase (TagB/SpsB family)